MAATKSNTAAEIQARKRKAMKIYGLSTTYDSMRLIKNLSVLIEFAQIVSQKADHAVLIPYLIQPDLEEAMSNVTKALDLSGDSWTIYSALPGKSTLPAKQSLKILTSCRNIWAC